MKALQAECEELRTAKHAAEAAVAAANAAFSSRGPSPATDEAAQQDVVSPDESAAATSEEGDWLFKCPHRSLSVDVIMQRLQFQREHTRTISTAMWHDASQVAASVTSGFGLDVETVGGLGADLAFWNRASSALAQRFGLIDGALIVIDVGPGDIPALVEQQLAFLIDTIYIAYDRIVMESRIPRADGSTVVPPRVAIVLDGWVKTDVLVGSLHDAAGNKVPHRLVSLSEWG